MKVVSQIILLLIAFLVTSAGVIFLMTNVSPESAGFTNLLILYLLILGSISSLMTLIGYYFRKRLWRKSSQYVFMHTSRRQGFFFGLFVVALLLLRTNALLSIWTAVSLFIIFALLELYAQ